MLGFRNDHTYPSVIISEVGQENAQRQPTPVKVAYPKYLAGLVKQEEQALAELTNRKRKLAEEVDEKPKNVFMQVKKPSDLNQCNSEKLNLSRSQQYERLSNTMAVLKPVHCCQGMAPEAEEMAIKNGMWVALTNKCTVQELSGYAKT